MVRNAVILTASVLLTFVVLRAALHASPESDFNLRGYNIHHLFTGVVLIVLGGVPLALFRGVTLRLELATVVFGVGLGMALDEWVYLIATDGSNSSYLLPVSFWGGLLAVAIAVASAAGLTAYRARKNRAGGRIGSASERSSGPSETG